MDDLSFQFDPLSSLIISANLFFFYLSKTQFIVKICVFFKSKLVNIWLIGPNFSVYNIIGLLIMYI